MHFLLYLFSLFLLVSSNSVSSFQPSCSDYERVALLRFKNSFHIDCSISANPYNITPYAKVKSWVGGRSVDCCSWDGVDCNKKTGHVIGLNLTASCLYGTFPPTNTIFNLAYLTNLVLSYNDFNYSRIPSEISRFHNLQILELLDSKFSGQIPAEVSKLSKLSVLELGEGFAETQLLKLDKIGSLEKLVQNLTSLQVLFLQNVDVSSTIPVILRNITTLREINIVNCNLFGKLPANIFRLPHLETLELSINEDLGGSLPEFHWHSPLRRVSLYSTSLSGNLPPSIGRLAQLELLLLSGCQISGIIPYSLGNLTNLSSLYLNNNYLSGVIPASISNLTNLKVLYLSDLNVLPGQLIANFAKLRKLTVVALSGMKLGDEISPFLANLTELRHLALTNTQVVGRLPRWFANLTQLELLNLSGNQLEGPIPRWFTKLKNLQILSLSYNNFHANFETFSGLENLRDLDLSGITLTFPLTSQKNSSLSKLKLLKLESCNLTEFPAFLRDAHELEHLQLRQNHITGKIPQWFVNTTKETLLRLELYSNNLTGFEQPVTVLPWTSLEVFDIGSNNFGGKLLVPPVSIIGYDVSNNMFTGLLPKQICMARSPIKLDLSNNNLSSQPISHCLGDKLGDSLQILNLRGNSFHGSIPRSFTTYCSLKMINLSENQLEGDLPRSLANCTMLEVLDIGKNHINDTFPSWLGSLYNLQVFVLSHNKFHGSISDQDLGAQFCSLRIIDLSHNFYTGHLPLRYLRSWNNMMIVKEDQSNSYNTIIYFPLKLDGKYYAYTENYEYSMTITSKGSEKIYSKILKVFRVIDFSNNNFRGKIPDVIGELKGLQALNLSNNNLDGKIPTSMINMRDLESLDFSRNKLFGLIPAELSELTTLEVFDVSYNNLEGPIPQGNQFNTFENSSYVGNSRLCGSPLSKKCHQINDTPASQMTNDPSSGNSELIDWIVRSSGCVSGFIIGVVIGKLCITDKYHEWFMETFQRKPRRKANRAPRHQRRR